jgi:hypothetical protein
VCKSRPKSLQVRPTHDEHHGFTACRFLSQLLSGLSFHINRRPSRHFFLSDHLYQFFLSVVLIQICQTNHPIASKYKSLIYINIQLKLFISIYQGILGPLPPVPQRPSCHDMHNEAIQRWLDSIPRPALGHDSQLESLKASQSYLALHTEPGRFDSGLRNPMPGRLLKTLPAQHVKAVMPDLLGKKLGFWGILELLPYSPSTKSLVSRILTHWSLILVTSALYVDSPKAFSDNNMRLSNRSIVAS